MQPLLIRAPDQSANPFVRKLGRVVPLAAHERAAIDQLCRNPRQHARGTSLVHEGDRPQSIFLMLTGWAHCYKQLENGRRQIISYLLPGDISDIRVGSIDKMDHSIGLLSDAEVVHIPAAEIFTLMDRFPRIERAVMLAALAREATMREWLLNVGQRFALQRVAHLFCEVRARLSVVGLIDDKNSFALPLSQIDLADTTGMTAMHVNRMLRRLRNDKLISTHKGRLTILSLETLAGLAGFNKDYLHADGPVAEKPNLKVLSSVSGHGSGDCAEIGERRVYAGIF